MRGMMSVLAALILTAALVSAEGAGRCVDDVLSSASSCLPSDFTNGLVSNLTLLRLYCRDGVFSQSVQCLAELKTSCEADRERSHLLHSLLDLRAWEAAWNDLCSNLHDLQQHHICWSVTSQRSADCIRDKMADFRLRMTAADNVRSSAAAASSSSSSLSLMSRSEFLPANRPTTGALNNIKVYCNLSQPILHCFQATLYELCPLETSRLLEATYLAFQPPLCRRKQQHRSVSEDDSDLESESKTETETVGKSVTSLGRATFTTPEYSGISVVLFFVVMEMLVCGYF